MTNIKTFKLKNGITVIHQQEKTSLAHVRICFNVGSIVETAGQKGIAHLIEHLMFKGTKTRTGAEVAKLLEIKGAKINAYTTWEKTCYHASIKREFIETIFDLFSDMIKNKSITEEEFENEKLIVIQELKMGLDEHAECNFYNFCKQIYALDPIIGYENILKKLTLKDVYAFMKRYYNSENITISLLTEQKHSDIKSLLNKYFGDIPTGLKNIYKPLVVKHKQIVKKEKDIEQVYLMHLYPLADFGGIKEYMKAGMLCNILSGGLSSILHREIREKYGLTYHIDADLALFHNPELSKNIGVCLYIVSSMDNKNLKKYLKVLPELIKTLPDIITEEDLERVKNKRTSREYINVETKAASNHFCYTHFGKITPYEERDKIYFSIALKEIKTFVRKYLNANNVSYAMYGPIR